MNISNFSLTPSAKIEQQPGEQSDLNQLLSTFRRHTRIFIAVAIVVFVAVMLVTFQQTPRYPGKATVMIDTRKHEVSDITDVLSGLPMDTSVVDTEVEVLQSRSLAERVVTALNLDQDPEFNYTLRPRNPITAVVTAPFNLIGSIFSPQDDSPAARARAEELERVKKHERVVDHVLKRLTVVRSGLTYVIDITFESEVPSKAALISNTFAEKYLTEQLEAKYDATLQATQWLNQRLAELQPQVATAQAAVEQYKAQHGLLASVGSTLTEQEISNLNTELAQAKADLAEKDATYRTAQAQVNSGASNGEDMSGPLSSSTVMQLRTQQAEASSKVADLETKYGPRFPEVLRAQRQLADTNAQISAEMSRQVANLQAEDEIARQRVASLESSLAGAKGTLIGNNAASVEMAELQRRADAASTLYDSLLNRAKQTQTDQGSEQSDARVVSRAKIPIKPSFPNFELNAVLGLALGMIAGAGSVFLMEALDSGLTTSEDVERFLNLPHLGAIPLLDSTTDGKAAGLTPGQYVVQKPLSAFSEAFRNLRASILFSKVDSPVKVVILTSALPGEGKTTTAFCLGKSMAMSGAAVIVVDCDLRRRNINRLLGIEPEYGLIEVLQGTRTLDEVLIHDEDSGAYFLPLAKSSYTPKDLFGSAAMDRLLETLRQRFDLVLLDTAPVIPVSDTRILAPKGDVVVFLAQWRQTPRKAIEASLSLLSSVGADIAGLVLTLVDAREQAKYGYGDAGYYYRSYRKYYAQ